MKLGIVSDLHCNIAGLTRALAREFGPRLEPMLETDDFLVIGVNTVMPRWHQQGLVSRRQVRRVANRLGPSVMARGSNRRTARKSFRCSSRTPR